MSLDNTPWLGEFLLSHVSVTNNLPQKRHMAIEDDTLLRLPLTPGELWLCVTFPSRPLRQRSRSAVLTAEVTDNGSSACGGAGTPLPPVGGVGGTLPGEALPAHR